MKSEFISVIAITMTFTGCIMWDAGYTDNNPVIETQITIDERIPISYDVILELDRSDIIAAPEIQELKDKIEVALKTTGLFSEVSYGKGDVNDSYHASFLFRQAGMSVEDSMAVGLLAGYTLLLVPTGELLTFDGSAILSLKGKPIYTTAKAEELRCLIWLPMAPAGIFMNSWAVWHYAEQGTVNALVNDIATYHRSVFLNTVTVTAANRMFDQTVKVKGEELKDVDVK